MKAYSDLIDRVLLGDGLLSKLRPKEPRDRQQLRKVMAADDLTLAGGKTAGVPVYLTLLRGAVLYGLDALEECHAVFQDVSNDCGSYWHGMMHRREGDFENAKYWFRRAGELPCFQTMHHEASLVSADMAKQITWDPFLYTNQCEQERFGAEELTREMVALQRVEFEVLLDYCWRQAQLQ